jgi:hypothetical protein
MLVPGPFPKIALVAVLPNKSPISYIAELAVLNRGDVFSLVSRREKESIKSVQG